MKFTNCVFAISTYLAADVAAQYSSSTSAPSVKIQNGTVVGVHSAQYNQDFFLGIPYALPPVGELRWQPAQYVNKTSKTINASKYGYHCVGYGSDQWGYEQSEDCLTLNVVRPANIEPWAYLPVAVWIHGGGFVEGGSGDARYNLSFIVENSMSMGTPIVAVSINYRLSAWGFLNSREVSGTGNANLGLRDQRLALHWVQENIQAFGGDPTKVTIWGESAGAASVGAHLIAYSGRDDKLFRSAIMESGSPVYYLEMQWPQTNQVIYDGMLNATNCTDAADSLDCLRKVDYTTLNSLINTTDVNMAFGPAVDGDFIGGYASQFLKEGKFVKVPIIIGANSDEGTAFAQLGPAAANTTEDIIGYLEYTTHLKPDTISKLLDFYNEDISIPPKENLTGVETPASLGTEFHRLAAITGDAIMIANKRYTAESWTAYNTPVWTYRFKANVNGIPPFIGATHFVEVVFVFDNVNGDGYVAGNPLGGNNTQAARALANTMSRSWVGFIHSNNPNANGVTGVPVWPHYQEGTGAQQIVYDYGDLFIETDNFRAEGISLINEYAMQYGR